MGEQSSGQLWAVPMDDVWVVCPSCSERAIVLGRRVACGSCGFVETAPTRAELGAFSLDRQRWEGALPGFARRPDACAAITIRCAECGVRQETVVRLGTRAARLPIVVTPCSCRERAWSEAPARAAAWVAGSPRTPCPSAAAAAAAATAPVAAVAAVAAPPATPAIARQVVSFRWLGPSPDHPVDRMFGLPFWLQTPCVGEVLWAANQKHLDYLHAFIGEPFRPTAGLGATLPKWMITRKHRAEVLRALTRLDDLAGP